MRITIPVSTSSGRHIDYDCFKCNTVWTEPADKEVRICPECGSSNLVDSQPYGGVPHFKQPRKKSHL